MTDTAAQYDPGDAPAHQCINASCGCNDLVTAGGCSEWCMGNGVEQADLETGKARPVTCGCGHATCHAHGKTGVGTPERGMA